MTSVEEEHIEMARSMGVETEDQKRARIAADVGTGILARRTNATQPGESVLSSVAATYNATTVNKRLDKDLEELDRELSPHLRTQLVTALGNLAASGNISPEMQARAGLVKWLEEVHPELGKSPAAFNYARAFMLRRQAATQ